MPIMPAYSTTAPISSSHCIFGRQLMALSAVSPARMMQSRMVRMTKHPQMIWVYAVLILTKVMKLPSIWNGSAIKKPHVPVYAHPSVLVPKIIQAVTIRSTGSHRQPTTRFWLNTNAFSHALWKSAKVNSSHCGPSMTERLCWGQFVHWPL
jgi:hypothetical protein